MRRTLGINHAAIITADLDRFIDFYTTVFDATVLFEETFPAFRHALVGIGGGAALHAIELPAAPSATAPGGRPGTRGHVDHLGITAASVEDFEWVRSRLIECDASDGHLSDLGAMIELDFVDPDGMAGQVCLVVDPNLHGLHSPRPMSADAWLATDLMLAATAGVTG